MNEENKQLETVCTEGETEISEALTKSLKMGTMPMGKLLAVMSGPAIFSMLVQALYNIVDSIFVAKVSGNATSALSLAFPMQMLLMSFAFGIGVGCNSIISRRLGEKHAEDAKNTAQTGMALSLIVAAFFAIFGYFIAKGFISAYVNSGEYVDPEAVKTYGIEYLSIVMCVSFGMYIEIFCNKVWQAQGNMTIPMIAQLIGAITNIILDPILIFGLLGMPRLEVKGAAIATVVGQIFAMIFTLLTFKYKKAEINVFINHGFKMEKRYVSEIMRIGIPVTILNSVGSITTATLNSILNRFGAAAVSVLGIYFKLQSFIFMPVFGLCQGAMPIMGYNYGAGNKDRFKKVTILSMMVAFAIMVIGTLIFQLLPDKLLSLFKPSSDDAAEIAYYTELLLIGENAFRLISLAFIPAAFCIIIVNLFQSLGKGFTSMMMSLVRQIVVLLPVAAILAKYSGLEATWWCYPIGEVTSLIIFAPIAIKTVNKLFFDKTEKSLPPVASTSV